MITAWLHEEIIQKNNTMRKLDPVLLIKTGFITDQYIAVPVSKKIKPFQKKNHAVLLQTLLWEQNLSIPLGCED